MTNATIILNESFRLMEEGILKGSGQFAQIEDASGEIREIELPEAIHTFNGWKERGYAVKKGEKSAIKFPIWKHSAKKSKTDNGEDEAEAHMFMKVSAFFTFAQVEPIKAKA